MTVDRYRVNDVLTALAREFLITPDDDTLNELTHHVADVLEAADPWKADPIGQVQRATPADGGRHG